MTHHRAERRIGEEQVWDLLAQAPVGVRDVSGRRERARGLGGRCTIASGPGGTTVRVNLPLGSAS